MAWHGGAGFGSACCGKAWQGPAREVPRAAGDDVCRFLYAELKVHPQVDRLKMGLEWLKEKLPVPRKPANKGDCSPL